VSGADSVGIEFVWALMWGLLAGLCWARGSWTAAAVICAGRRSFGPLVFKAATVACLYFGLRLGRELWPWLLVGVVLGGLGSLGFAVLVRQNRLR
jgi:hypothetical protein